MTSANESGAEPTAHGPRLTRSRSGRIAILLLGLILGQAILIGPSLLGRKVLLPLDLLAAPGAYLPADRMHLTSPPNNSLFDAVLLFEMTRQYAVSEVRAGHIPLWNPYNYCGAPFLAANQTAVLSPFRLLDYLWPGPTVLAWDQLLRVLVAGTGAYLFFRRVLKVQFAAAVFGAWLYPLTGFFVLWAWSPTGAVMVWFPWLLLAVDGAVRQPGKWSGLGLAATTAAALLTGHGETAVQMLAASLVYALWCLVDTLGFRRVCSVNGAKSIAAVTGGLVLGILFSAPQTLPTLEYLQYSYRLQERWKGGADVVSPVGYRAMWLLVWPDFYGKTGGDSVYLLSGNRIESPAEGYTGLLVALFLAPLGTSVGRLRSIHRLWYLLALVGVIPSLGLPVVGTLLALPPFALLRCHRFLFLTAWALLALGVAGLDSLVRGEVRWRPRFWLPIAVILGFGMCCAWNASFGMSALRDVLAQMEAVLPTEWVGPDRLATVSNWFARVYWAGVFVCLPALGLWVALRRGIHRQSWFAWVAGLLAGVELLAMAYGVNPQSDRSLYYPPQPALESLHRLPPGRICGINCLPADLNLSHRLVDIRGYDGLDPAPIVELLRLFRDPRFEDSPDYAAVQLFVPVLSSPLADLVNLRYLVFRGQPPAHVEPVAQSDDYWVVERRNCLPRAFVPTRTVVVNDKVRRLQLLADPDFDPRQVAYVECESSPPSAPAQGQAQIVAETSGRVRIRVDMKTPGLVVLADQWSPGWIANYNGRSIPVLRADHALRGVVVPAGTGELEFRYEPASFRNGLWLAAGAALAGLVWAIAIKNFF
jgi:hypothetical protein